jgi:hypothetical protein
MIDPPTDPVFGEIDLSFGVSVISLATTSFPFGTPTSKKTLLPLRIRSEAFVIVKTAVVESTDFVYCFTEPT